MIKFWGHPINFALFEIQTPFKFRWYGGLQITGVIQIGNKKLAKDVRMYTSFIFKLGHGLKRCLGIKINAQFIGCCLASI